MLSGVSLHDRADGRVDFRIHQHNIFTMLEGFQSNLCAEFDRASEVYQHIHFGGTREQESIAGDDGLPFADREINIALDDRGRNILDSYIFAKIKRTLRTAVVHPD